MQCFCGSLNLIPAQYELGREVKVAEGIVECEDCSRSTPLWVLEAFAGRSS